MKSRALNALVAACTLFLLASTAKAQPCANLSLSFNPTSAAPGQSMTVMGSATNCSGTSEASRATRDHISTSRYGDRGGLRSIR